VTSRDKRANYSVIYIHILHDFFKKSVQTKGDLDGNRGKCTDLLGRGEIKEKR